MFVINLTCLFHLLFCSQELCMYSMKYIHNSCSAVAPSNQMVTKNYILAPRLLQGVHSSVGLVKGVTLYVYLLDSVKNVLCRSTGTIFWRGEGEIYVGWELGFE